MRRLPTARRRARGQAVEVIDLGSGAHVGLRKEEEEEEEEEELRVLPRALAEALWAPTTSVRPAFQASWTSLLAPSQRTLTLGFSPKGPPHGKVVEMSQTGSEVQGKPGGPKPSLLSLTQQPGAARHSTFASWRERHSATKRLRRKIRGGRGWREERCEGEILVRIRRAAGARRMDRVIRRLHPVGKIEPLFLWI